MPSGGQNRLNLVGQRFSRLTVLEFSHSWFDKKGRPKKAIWKCLCDCGTIKDVVGGGLTSGKTQSCGCLNRENTSKTFKTHGMTGSKEHAIWKAMRQRCINPNDAGYEKYGGRGIAVCERWMESFENFYADMSDKPPGKSLDRIDNEGDYCPENCRWADDIEQANNKRNTVWIPFDGKTLTFTGWSKETGLPRTTIVDRYYKGWSAEKIVTTPKSDPHSKKPWRIKGGGRSQFKPKI
jgi:hypothetical protein